MPSTLYLDKRANVRVYEFATAKQGAFDFGKPSGCHLPVEWLKHRLLRPPITAAGHFDLSSVAESVKGATLDQELGIEEEEEGDDPLLDLSSLLPALASLGGCAAGSGPVLDDSELGPEAWRKLQEYLKSEAQHFHKWQDQQAKSGTSQKGLALRHLAEVLTFLA
ncbi:hypothetical protein OE88DRAFT_1740078 [Heliocybe sulcata]|uniref:Uncharacterized protein n=1 Tax=Heliocybe sulcata TaxID=5364 RepID=A0A5C3MLZ2_9AGAM|nr:hypothetical protein OE88DRAFT_1740078 [Heliocybe sulcata]